MHGRASTSRLLKVAAEIAGGERALAGILGIEERLLVKFMSNARPFPDALLLKVVDVVLAEREARRTTGAMREPPGILEPPGGLRERLARRIAADSGAAPVLPAAQWREPEWEAVAPGISRQLLARDEQGGLASMLVRLDPGGEYPPHTRAAPAELHLLDGELWIGEHRLDPGGYDRAEPGAAERRVRSPTGCTCVLITRVPGT